MDAKEFLKENGIPNMPTQFVVGEQTGKKKIINNNMDYKKTEKEIIKATKEFATINNIHYDELTESMILNAMRELNKCFISGVSQGSEQLSKQPIRIEGHTDDCQCKPCRLLKSIFSNC